MQDDEEARAARRRSARVGRSVFLVPGYQGHWIGAVLFGATLVGASMLWARLPMAMAILDSMEVGATSVSAGASFLMLYAAMAVGPIAGWTLWGLRRRWAALAVMAIFAVCLVGLGRAVMP